MKIISDLSWDMLEEILSRVPTTSLRAVRYTCKQWNALSKDRIVCKAEARQQFLGFVIKDYKICSMRLSLHGNLNEESQEVLYDDPSIKDISSLFNSVEISKIFHCNGLLLCVPRNNTRLLVWNPYLERIRWIEPINSGCRSNIYAIGYDNEKNHKILRFLVHYNTTIDNDGTVDEYEIFDFKSNSWRVLDVTPDLNIIFNQHGVSLKGNTFFVARRSQIGQGSTEIGEFLLCFDYTRERFGPRLPLPFHYSVLDVVGLSCVREEQLAVLFKPFGSSKVRIWVTTSIRPNAVLWCNFLSVDIPDFRFKISAGSFFIDQEKKLAVVFSICSWRCSIGAHIIGENGYLRKVDLQAVHIKELMHDRPLVCSYVPSAVKINQDESRMCCENHINQGENKRRLLVNNYFYDTLFLVSCIISISVIFLLCICFG